MPSFTTKDGRKVSFHAKGEKRGGGKPTSKHGRSSMTKPKHGGGRPRSSPHHRRPGLIAQGMKVLRAAERVAVRIVPAVAIVGGAGLITAGAIGAARAAGGGIQDRAWNLGKGMIDNRGELVAGTGLISAGIIGHAIISNSPLR